MELRICPPRTVRSTFLVLFLVALAGLPLLSQTGVPAVSITFPPEGATVSGQTYITINSSFNLPLTGQEIQQIYVDGSLVWTSSRVSLVTSTPWDTATLSPGSHVLVATVNDGFGNTAASSPTNVTVSNGLGGADLTPPTAPANLVATSVACDKVSLSWTSSTDVNGSGVRAYTIYRTSYLFGSISIAANRTFFNDTDGVREGTTYTYYAVAQDFAGNVSAAGNRITVSTPACSRASSDDLLDFADTQPSGRVIAHFGTRDALVYQKLNPSTGRYDSHLQLRDDTGAKSHFLLHSDEYETDYVLTSAATFWTMSKTGGSISVNQYQLSGSPIPGSATLISSQTFGDANSCPKSLFRLRSGGLLAAWTSDCADYGSSAYIQLFVAYWNPSGQFWDAPIAVTLYPDTWKERISIAQHPSDNSIWIFNLEDTGGRIGATHFTESPQGLNLDWNNAWFIASRNSSGNIQDGPYGPADEYAYLAAVADPVRNTIDLAYQSNNNAFVYVDPLFQNGNSIFLKEDPITIAHIGSDGSKLFNAAPVFTERTAYFGLSVAGDGSLWLAYFPIDRQGLTWNRVYTTSYSNRGWNQPTLVASDLNSIYDWDNSGPRWDPGFLVYRQDKPEIALRSTDGRIHALNLDGTSLAPDTTPPSTPTNLVASSITSSSIVLSWTASSDNVAVAGYNIYRCQGAGCTPLLIGTTSAISVQDSGLAPGGVYTYAVAAFDASTNISASSPWVSVTTLPTVPSSVPAVTITNPPNGAKLRGSSVTIGALATDTKSIARIELYIDGSLKAQTAGASLSYKWNTNKIALGAHSIQSRAYDSSGAMGVGGITVYK